MCKCSCWFQVVCLFYLSRSKIVFTLGRLSKQSRLFLCPWYGSWLAKTGSPILRINNNNKKNNQHTTAEISLIKSHFITFSDQITYSSSVEVIHSVHSAGYPLWTLATVKPRHRGPMNCQSASHKTSSYPARPLKSLDILVLVETWIFWGGTSLLI